MYKKLLILQYIGANFWILTRDVTSRGSNSNSTRSSNLYYCSIRARSSIFLFETKLELARTRKKSSKVQPKYRCQSITLAFSKKYLTLGKKNFHTWLKSFLSNGLLPDFLPENTKGPDVRQCWSLWTKMHVTRKQSSTWNFFWTQWNS